MRQEEKLCSKNADAVPSRPALKIDIAETIAKCNGLARVRKIRSRHEPCNFQSGDGSEGHKWRDPATIKAATDSANGVESYYWNGGTASNPDFAWVYERYRYQSWKPLQ